MTIARGFRFKLEPLPEQEALFRQFAGVCRLVYNLALQQKATWGWKHRLGYVAQAADLTRLRAEFDWVRAAGCAPSTCRASSRLCATSTAHSATSSRAGRASRVHAAAVLTTASASLVARSR